LEVSFIYEFTIVALQLARVGIIYNWLCNSDCMAVRKLELQS